MKKKQEGYANGYRPKKVRTKIVEITFAVPQVRNGRFYPSALEKGLRSEIALVTTLVRGDAASFARKNGTNEAGLAGRTTEYLYKPGV